LKRCSRALESHGLKTILMLAERIRNEVNDRQLERTRFLNRLDDWFALCVAMDYLL